MEISVVIPVYNNASSIEELTDRLSRTFASTATIYEVIFINDGSTDGSIEILREVGSKS